MNRATQKRVAVVTGGSSGIGYSIAERMVDDGYRVAILGRDDNKLLKAKERLGEECTSFRCDVSNVQMIEVVLEKVFVTLGSIDVLVNCAGVLDTSKIDTLTEQEWDYVIDINLKGTYFMIQQALPYLGQSKSPRIVNISSNAGRMGGFENGLAYTASKGGIIALTYGAARRLAPKGITVNCVAPGTIVTEMAEKGYDEETRQRLTARFPIGRMGRPEEVADAVLYFASEKASFTTGAVLDVNGGLFMG